MKQMTPENFIIKWLKTNDKEKPEKEVIVRQIK